MLTSLTRACMASRWPSPAATCRGVLATLSCTAAAHPSRTSVCMASTCSRPHYLACWMPTS